MPNEFKTMTLSECAKYDHMQGAKNKLTGWGIICKQRAALGISRRARINRKGQLPYHIHLMESTHTTKCGRLISEQRVVPMTLDHNKVTCPACRERM